MFRRMILALVLFCFASITPLDAKPRVRFGGVSVNAGYSTWSRWGYSPWYGSFGPAYGYAPLWMWNGFYPGFYQWGSDKGQIRLKHPEKTAEVFIDGAFAGSVGDLKSMWLQPGAYHVEIRGATDGAVRLQKRVYVLSGKVLQLR